MITQPQGPDLVTMDQDIWVPNAGPQTLLVRCPIYETFYGGARGGGKTDGLLGDFAEGVNKYGSAWQGVLFRRKYPELEQVIHRSKEIYYRAFPGAKFLTQSKTWRYPSGAFLRMRFLEKDDDILDYQGHQYSWMGFDELTSWASSFCYDSMMACARSPHGVPVRIRSSGNPGGPGHQWVKARFIDPAPPLTVITDEQGLKRIFIPARVEDNPRWKQRDPDYEKRLRSIADPALRRAWLLGDWDAFIGAVFQEWRRDIHTCNPFPIPAHWRRFTACDWGYATPFSIGWYAIDEDGRIWRYREWYGAEEKPANTGLRMTADLVGERMLKIERGTKEVNEYRVLGGDAWQKRGGSGPTVAETFEDVGVYWDRADNDRIQGLQQVHLRLNIPDDYDKDRQETWPMLMVFNTCTKFIEMVPPLGHDKNNPEDVDKDSEDHVYEETRYACMSRPIGAERPKEKKEAEWLRARRRRAGSWKTR